MNLDYHGKDSTGLGRRAWTMLIICVLDMDGTACLNERNINNALSHLKAGVAHTL